VLAVNAIGELVTSQSPAVPHPSIETRHVELADRRPTGGRMLYIDACRQVINDLEQFGWIQRHLGRATPSRPFSAGTSSTAPFSVTLTELGEKFNEFGPDLRRFTRL